MNENLRAEFKHSIKTDPQILHINRQVSLPNQTRPGSLPHKTRPGVCAYCRTHDNYLTKDHYIPKSKQGSDHDYNIVYACGPCNWKKSGTIPFNTEWELPDKDRLLCLQHSPLYGTNP